MLTTIARAWNVPDLRKRMLFVLGMFALFMLALQIPVPGIDRHQMEKLFQNGGVLNLLNMFSGGALRRYSILAMSITPYINATIIMQLLGVLMPQIDELQKEGESGRRQIAKWTRWLTIVLAVLQASMMNIMFVRQRILNVTWEQFIAITIILTAGTTFLMWMGELITEQGIGNGVSLVIFVGIMVRMPQQFLESWQEARVSNGFLMFAILMILFLLVITSMVIMTDGERRIKIQSARKVSGTKVYQGSTTYLPIPLLKAAGVMPIIFAISVQLFPATVLRFFKKPGLISIANGLSPDGSWWGTVIYFALVVFFTYFYTAVTFKVDDISDNLRKSGSYIPAVRPGRPTHDYIDRILTRLTTVTALYLGFVALSQYYIPDFTGFKQFTLIGGTSLLIVVGVGLDTMLQLEAQLLMRDYEGFIK
ncbi:MAG TPA: preprotein translocase subunit SecY [Armatimonadota bacterium]|nr:preprotein translocase subunit SecY [Armatimonadota bacterium]